MDNTVFWKKAYFGMWHKGLYLLKQQNTDKINLLISWELPFYRKEKVKVCSR